jgi:hypothetical protein
MPDDSSLDARQIRLASNQALFRSVNDQVEELALQNHAIAGPISFVCECANPECADTIQLTHHEYEAIRQDPTRFLVLPGHVFPEVETVVDDRDHYAVVEKFGTGGAVAEATSTTAQ